MSVRCLALIGSMASLASLVSLGLITESGLSTPLAGAPDHAQYRADRWQFVGCFMNLLGPKPTCPYVVPAIPSELGLNQQVPQAAAVAAAGLNGDSRALLAAADALVASQVDGTWAAGPGQSLDGQTDEEPLSISAPAQGIAISALARAYALAPREAYLVAIEDAVRAVPIDESGWPARVGGRRGSLIGGMTALLGLWDAWRVTGDALALAAFRRGASWLDANIGTFERSGVVFESPDPEAIPLSPARLVYAMRQLQIVGTIAHKDGLIQRARVWEWRIANPAAFRLGLALQAASPQSYVLAGLIYVSLAGLTLWLAAGLARQPPPGRLTP